MKLLRLQLAYLYSGLPGGTVESRDAPKPWRVHHNHTKRNTVSAKREQEMADFEFEQYQNDEDGVLLLNWWAFSKEKFTKITRLLKIYNKNMRLKRTRTERKGPASRDLCLKFLLITQLSIGFQF